MGEAKVKRGIAFERAVRDVVAQIHPHAKVQQGQWVQGPDGRRDLDVSAEIVIDGVTRHLLIECKDYNPGRGPLGIKFVDELDSKRKDLNVDGAFICSNAGFTDDAVRKARRVGIGLIGVFREGDRRVRFEVRDEIYYRHVRLEDSGWGLGQEISLEGVPPEKILYAGAPVMDWVQTKILNTVGMNPIVNGTFEVRHRFKKPTEFQIPNGNFVAQEISYGFTIVGNWYSIVITIDGSAGLYDWLNSLVTLPIGKQAGHLKFKDLNLWGGELIDRPPLDFKFLGEKLRPEDFRWNFMRTSGFPTPPASVPALDDAIEPEDLQLTNTSWPEEAIRSKGAPIDPA